MALSLTSAYCVLTRYQEELIKDINSNCKDKWKSLWLEDLSIMPLIHIFNNLFIARQEALEI